MDERTAIAWLGRRVGFGLAPGELDRLAAAGLSPTLDQWLDPDTHGVAPAPDPWQGIDLSVMRPRGHVSRLEVDGLIGSWLHAMVTTIRPLEEWMRWFWHGHFVSTLGAVGSPPMMRDQLRTLGQFGLGDFPSLLRAVTLDPAMLLYLNGSYNRKGEVNENYGREVLELFALGIGHYSEADVRAGATALTGYGVNERAGTRFFNPALHDDTPQSYLGRTGVHDVDTVVDAIVNHPACGPFIAGKLARAVLGPDVDSGLVTRLAKDFVASGLQLRPLLRAIVEAGIERGASTPLVLSPVPWTMSMARAVGLTDPTVVLSLSYGLPRAGQVPLSAPNVGGWPGGAYWLTASATLGRFGLAGTLAMSADPASVAIQSAGRGDWDALADDLGHPEGFSTATRRALGGVDPGGEPQGDRARLALALAAPELVVA